MRRIAETEARRPHSIVRRRHACHDSFREQRGDSTLTEDMFCGVRSTYREGRSTTGGDVYGACWGQGILREAREGLDGAPEGVYVGLWNYFPRVAKRCTQKNPRWLRRVEKGAESVMRKCLDTERCRAAEKKSKAAAAPSTVGISNRPGGGRRGGRGGRGMGGLVGQGGRRGEGGVAYAQVTEIWV